MKRSSKVFLALVCACLFAGAATSSFAGVSDPKSDDSARCRYIYDSNGNVVGYCCGNVCINP